MHANFLPSGGMLKHLQWAIGTVGRVLVGLSRSGGFDFRMAYYRRDYGCSSSRSTGGIVEVFPQGFPSTRGLRITANAFLPI